MQIDQGEVIRVSLGSSNAAACAIAGFLMVAKPIDIEEIEAEFNQWLDRMNLQDINAALETALALKVVPTVPANYTPDNWYSDAFFVAWLLTSRPDLVERDHSLGGHLSNDAEGKLRFVSVVTGQIDRGNFGIRRVGEHAGLNLFVIPKNASGRAKLYRGQCRTL